MKGHVYRRGKSWSYLFDIEPDPLTGRRRQASGSGFKTEREAWKACRAAMADYEKGHMVRSSRRKVADALEEWLARIEYSIKPSMVQNWRNYAAYYVIPYIGQRDAQDIDGAVCDALYAKLLAEGRVKAKPRVHPQSAAVHSRRLSATGRVLPCRPYRWDTVRWYRTRPADDPVIGQPIAPRKVGRRAAEAADEAARKKPSSGLEPKTVVNTHRMLHRAWEDFTAWGWVKRNVVNEAHPPRVPRKGRKVWAVSQLQAFLRRARSDRFFALWVLEATSGIRRCELAGARRELLSLDAGALAIEAPGFPWTARLSSQTARPRTPVVRWRWIPSRWPRCAHMSKCWSASGPSSARTTKITVCCSAGRRGGLRTQTQSRAGSRSWPPQRACPRLTCTTSGTATRPRAAMRRSTGRR